LFFEHGNPQSFVPGVKSKDSHGSKYQVSGDK